MMLLDRYLARAVIGGTLMALLVLLAIDVFFAFVNEVQEIGRGTYDMAAVMYYLVFTIPRRAHDLFPMSALLGSLMGLGALAAHSELVGIRAAGVSIGRIVRSVLQAGVLMLVVAALVGEWVAPRADRAAEDLRASAQLQKVTFHSEHGFWARDGNQFVNIRGMAEKGTLRDIRVFELDEAGRLVLATQAQTAEFREGRWQLRGVQRSTLGEDSLETRSLRRLNWASILSPELLSVVMVEPERLSTRELRRYIEYMETNELDADRYWLALWTRVMAPLSSLVMLVLSVPFVFGPLRDVSAGQRLLVGVLVGIGFFLLNRTMGHLGQVYGLPPLLSAAGPAMLFLLGGLYALRRVR